jgi:CRISPR-associated protein Cmr4
MDVKEEIRMYERDTLRIYGLSTDPIYIGTGGYTIGRVDNTIVRDSITKIPKIPGSSIAGTWRYYMALEIQNWFRKNYETIKSILDENGNTTTNDDIRELINRLADRELNDKESISFSERVEVFKKYSEMLNEKMNSYNQSTIKSSQDEHNWQLYWGNLISSIKCAGQDDKPNEDRKHGLELHEISGTGHCGHCMVCKTFGFSKKDKSHQGIAFFSDFNILFFPVYTRLGVKWVTSPFVLESAAIKISFRDNNLNVDGSDEKHENTEVVSSFTRLRDQLGENSVIMVLDSDMEEKQEYINLGWLNLKVKHIGVTLDLADFPKREYLMHHILRNIIVAPDSLISHIINSNLEVRSSVSIDPLTGAAKERALFTSEAIPRGTVFYGDLRLFEGLREDIPSIGDINRAFKDSKKYYETLGVGGMVTRGFGRLKVYFP